LSYLTESFGVSENHSLFKKSGNRWECREIGAILVSLGYCVDVINFNDTRFKPIRKYTAIIDLHSNLERLERYLPENCIKILHLTGSHWLFQNAGEYDRIKDFYTRHGVVIKPMRQVKATSSHARADYFSCIGNRYTMSTYASFPAPIYPIPVTSPAELCFPEKKEWEAVRYNLLWFGSFGAVHKGLDLLIDYFAAQEDFYLTIAGPVEKERDFYQYYKKKITDSSTIFYRGWIDQCSKEFAALCDSCSAVILPSCSEGQAGSVIACMKRGLIPVVSKQSGIDTTDFGFVIDQLTVAAIAESLHKFRLCTAEDIKIRARKAWEYVRDTNSREQFSKRYTAFLKQALSHVSVQD